MHSLTSIGIAIQKSQKTYGLALLRKLAGHLEHDHTAGGVPGKVVGSGGLHRAHVLYAVGSKYSQVGLMLVEKYGELEAVDRLLRTEFGSEFDKAQQTSPNS